MHLERISISTLFIISSLMTSGGSTQPAQSQPSSSSWIRAQLINCIWWFSEHINFSFYTFKFQLSSCYLELNQCLLSDLFFLMIFSGGPYASFAGRDASRALGTFNVNTSDQTEYDDLSDLSAMEMDAIKEWELQFKGEVLFILFFILYGLVWWLEWVNVNAEVTLNRFIEEQFEDNGFERSIQQNFLHIRFEIWNSERSSLLFRIKYPSKALTRWKLLEWDRTKDT